MSDKENLIEVINLCWDSVNESKVGPILKMSVSDVIPQINNIGLNTFYTIVSNVLPKNIQTYENRPKEPWQE